jgi:hypothetical protein
MLRRFRFYFALYHSGSRIKWGGEAESTESALDVGVERGGISRCWIFHICVCIGGPVDARFYLRSGGIHDILSGTKWNEME